MRKFVLAIATLLATATLMGQTSMSFYHLGRATFQNSALNPAWVPEGRFFLGLPVLSGIHFNVNNKVSYNDVITKENNNLTLDIDRAIGNLQKNNMISGQFNANLFHLGFTFPAGATVMFFANERVEMDVLYPKQIIEFLWNGNTQFLSEEVKIGKLAGYASHFREFGLGFAYSPTAQLDVGIRLKYLVGFFNASTPGSAKVNLTTSGEFFQLDGELQNAQLRTSGLDFFDSRSDELGSHLAFNSNTGLAVDIGGEYKLNRYYSIAGSILDLGWINWKENVETHSVSDTTFRYSGINIEDVGDIQETLQDSLIDKFDRRETSEAYRGWLPIKAYGSWIYHYDSKTDFYASVGIRYIQRQFKMMYGGGVTREFGKIITLSASAHKLPQQFFNVGAAFAVNGGPVQLYLAADQVINFSAPDFKAFDFRFGINFRFRGRDDALTSNSGARGLKSRGGFGKNNDDGTLEGSKGIDTGAFLGSKVKTKKRDEIYSIIPRQKRPEPKANQRSKKVQQSSVSKRGSINSTPPKPFYKKSISKRDIDTSSPKAKKKKVQRKSLKGLSGKKKNN